MPQPSPTSYVDFLTMQQQPHKHGLRIQKSTAQSRISHCTQQNPGHRQDPLPPVTQLTTPPLRAQKEKNTGNAARTHTTDTAKPDQTRPDGGTDLGHVVHRAAPRVVLLHYMSYNSVVRPQSALLHTFIVVAATTTRSTERERHLLLRWSLPPSAMSVFHGRISWSGGLGMENPVRETTLLVYGLGERP